MKRINLLIYSALNLGFGGGFERWVKEVVPRLKLKGYRISIITTKAGELNDYRAKSELIKYARIIELNNWNKPYYFTIPKPSYFKDILILAKDVDIIYFNNSFAGNDIYLALIKKLTNVKVIAGYHGTFPHVGGKLRKLYYQTINRNLGRLFDGHHVVNSDRWKLLLTYGYKNIYLIPNGVDTSKFKPGRKRDTFTVLFVGRMTLQKGIDIIKAMIDYLNKRYVNEINFLINRYGATVKHSPKASIYV